MRTHRSVQALLFLAGVAVATPACAEQIYGYGGQRRSVYERNFERRAYDNGYRDGVQEGQNDARRGRDFSYQRHNQYRDADDGYRRGVGDRDDYRRSFRQGFQTGYSEAYSRYARNNNYPRGNYPVYGDQRGYPSNRGVYRSPAADNGYRDGFEAGRDDARDRDRYDPVRASRYRQGDHNYDSRYGSRDAYKRDYRAAFEQGYREGYGRGR
jgi:hypothetical protein